MKIVRHLKSEKSFKCYHTIDAALLIRDKKVVDPETNEVTYQPVSEEVIEELKSLVKSALGLKLERGDTLTVTCNHL